MNIQILGLNHKTAPIEIREKISFPAQRLDNALLSLKKYDSIEENLILSTCNRVEVYTVVRDIHKGSQAIEKFISDFHHIEPSHFRDHLYLFSDIKAVRHLFRVVSSLDSLVVGETQIFGQVKDAYFKARQCKTTGRILSELFQETIKLGKRIRSQTQIGKGAVSVSSAAIELSKKIFERLEGKKVLIIGAGKIGELAVKNLSSRGINTVLVANRTFEKAQELARVFCGVAIRFENFFEYLKEADILISSTSAPHFIITQKQILEAMQKRKHRPIFLIDLGLPRNIEPQVNKIDNVYLYNIDDLSGVCEANLKERLSEAKKAEQLIEQHIEQVVTRLLKS